MSQFPEPAEQLKDTPLRFLESEQFQEMLDTYNKLKPLEKEHPRKFKNQMNVFDFGDIYPLMDSYLQTHDLSSPEAVAEARRRPSRSPPRCWIFLIRPSPRGCRNTMCWATAPPPISSAASGRI